MDRVRFNGQSSGLWSLTSHWVVLFVFNANLAARLEFRGPCNVPDMNNQHQICVDEDAMLMDDLEDKVGVQEATLMEVPIPLLESQETKTDVVEDETIYHEFSNLKTCMTTTIMYLLKSA
uniref:Uncharacterized protein n=1 Tax=Solanum lycopersicum TaxID=4081 RepID=A0A3Q7EFP2_SOLLC